MDIMIKQFRVVCCCVLLTVLAMLAATDTVLAGDDSRKSTLPEAVEHSLDALLTATRLKKEPDAGDIQAVLAFILQSRSQNAKKIIPQDRQGKGIYYTTQLNLPLRRIMDYLLTPSVPGEALYPLSVRHTHWVAGSALIRESRKLLDAAFPPSSPISVNGTEVEETTPDTSSGCFYRYQLNRLFILSAIDGRTALICISVMPKESTVGNKGLIVNEKSWQYVYTNEKGTNLPMLSWAETQLYASSGITVYMENAAGGQKTDVAMFKWTRAGWSGMNVVKASHIEEGVKRFFKGFRTVIESPRCPSPAEIAAEAAKLKALDDKALRALLDDESKALAASTAEGLDDSPYQDVVKDGQYASTLSRDALLADAIKLWMRRQILGH